MGTGGWAREQRPRGGHGGDNEDGDCAEDRVKRLGKTGRGTENKSKEVVQGKTMSEKKRKKRRQTEPWPTSRREQQQQIVPVNRGHLADGVNWLIGTTGQ